MFYYELSEYGSCWSLRTSKGSPWQQRCLRGYLHPGRTWRLPSCHCASAADTPPPGPLYQRAAETDRINGNDSFPYYPGQTLSNIKQENNVLLYACFCVIKHEVMHCKMCRGYVCWTMPSLHRWMHMWLCMIRLSPVQTCPLKDHSVLIRREMYFGCRGEEQTDEVPLSGWSFSAPS